jgi:hypothetical protein
MVVSTISVKRALEIAVKSVSLVPVETEHYIRVFV